MIKRRCCRLPQRSLVAVGAKIGRWQMRGRLPRNRLQTRAVGAVMARETGARHKSMVHCCWRPRRCGMTAFASITRQYVLGAFAPGVCSIVACGAGRYICLSVVKLGHRRPSGGGVASLAGICRLQMLPAQAELAGCIDAVVTRHAGSGTDVGMAKSSFPRRE